MCRTPTVVVVALLSASAFAQVGETPAVPNHLDQAAIERGEVSFARLFAAGRVLFDARFNRLDGQGRPGSTGSGAPRDPDEPAFIRTSGPDSSSCSGCHAQPRSGGAGDFVANVFVLAQTLDPVTTSVDPLFSNERNTLGMMGAGPIEMLAREMTVELHTIREEARMEAAATGAPATRALYAKGVSFGTVTVLPDGRVDPSGIEGVDWDLIVKPFHQKGAVVSLRQFSNNAMNHHHGMQSVERFGADTDPDQDGVTNELTVGDITAVTVFQAALGTPGRVISRGKEEAIAAGEEIFAAIGCANCHIPAMELSSPYFTEPNPYNPGAAVDGPHGNLQESGVSNVYAFDMTEEGELPRLEKSAAGGAIVRAFTDLKRHTLSDGDIAFFSNEHVAQGKLNGFAPASDFTISPPPRPLDQFLTRKLWDCGNTAPYGHRGDCTTLTEAIEFHGGEARASRDAFLALTQEDRDKVIAFLKSMQILPEDAPGLTLTADENGVLEPWSREVALEDVRRCGAVGIIPLGLTLMSLLGARARRRRSN